MAQGKEQGRLGFRSPGSLKEAEQIDCFCLPNQVHYNVYKGIKQITGPSPSNLLRLATSGPPSGVLNASHNSIQNDTISKNIISNKVKSNCQALG